MANPLLSSRYHDLAVSGIKTRQRMDIINNEHPMTLAGISHERRSFFKFPNTILPGVGSIV
jgi:hypothetical protein